ncbi:uncharacterized protein PGTG_07556 [Puccinia graminis f. sp. tritici CRL 75-36-700-3]|uniref:Uncharacterized protein n=1 Tax=Puccinia graminis f. sp. tritici (strain CRL 75-36-700-3 / race SCCL) TaxID=418459 RepID=E3KCK7_PUCGT|nr:uncharacterized protein PGTG_07556 [Puccinia graminis f. sp. tritici CRL 75-36-700-3]EFP82159.1 hypothetical protein PGTG_07556 [Puccinia graminis f. sp. tritici CRL 75-36-700-3]
MLWITSPAVTQGSDWFPSLLDQCASLHFQGFIGLDQFASLHFQGFIGLVRG